MIKFNSFRKFIEDEGIVKRNVLIEENAVVEQKKIIVYKSMKCRLSNPRQRVLEQGQNFYYKNSYKLYYSSSYELKIGDEIEIQEKSFIVGEIIKRGDFYISLLEKKEIA